jgi:4-hydroxy-2-oxoheptanedioate aldolase
VRYPPQGERGFGPRRAALYDPKYVTSANREVFLGVQIETQKALNSLDEILSVPGIDAALVGPYDLTLSLGILGKFHHPSYRSAVKRLVRSAAEHSLVPGLLAVEDVEAGVHQGFRLLCVSADLVYLKEGATTTLVSARKATRGA